MIRKVTQIEQPCFGEYEERIYDIESPWNSSDWTWIVIEEDDSVWCGEFRGKYRGTAISEKIGITIVLTSDYLYVLDNLNAEIIEYESRPQYNQVSCTPYGDILLAEYYGLDVLREQNWWIPMQKGILTRDFLSSIRIMKYSFSSFDNK